MKAARCTTRHALRRGYHQKFDATARHLEERCRRHIEIGRARLPLLLAADRALLQLLFQKETEAVCTYAGLR